MTRLALRVIAILMLLTIFLPIPGIAVVAAMGLSILICSSLPFALFLQTARRKYSIFNRGMLWLEEKLGEKFSSNLRITRIDNDPREHFSR